MKSIDSKELGWVGRGGSEGGEGLVVGCGVWAALTGSSTPQQLCVVGKSADATVRLPRVNSCSTTHQLCLFGLLLSFSGPHFPHLKMGIIMEFL